MPSPSRRKPLCQDLHGRIPLGGALGASSRRSMPLRGSSKRFRRVSAVMTLGCRAAALECPNTRPPCAVHFRHRIPFVPTGVRPCHVGADLQPAGARSPNPCFKLQRSSAVTVGVGTRARGWTRAARHWRDQENRAFPVVSRSTSMRRAVRQRRRPQSAARWSTWKFGMSKRLPAGSRMTRDALVRSCARPAVRLRRPALPAWRYQGAGGHRAPTQP